MTSSPNPRPGPEEHALEEPGTSRMPSLGARLADSTPPARDQWADRHDDTGPVPITGERPLFPPGPASRPDLPEASGDEPPTTEQPAAPAKGSRAGRNLGAAIGVGLSLGAVIVLSLVLWRPAFLAVLLAAVLVGVVELTRALQAGKFRAPLIPLLVGAVAMIALAWTRGPTGLVTGFLVTSLAVVLWRLADGPAGYLRDASAGVLVALYVPLLAGFAALLLAPEDGAVRVFAFIATVVGSDVGGYAAGVLFGKHPMAPSISPKKSWEGMAGSVLACMGVATLLVWLWLGGPWWSGLVFGAAIAVSATVGDLAESLIKRDLGIKDMGNLLPGHGGLMDRLDSLLPSAAVAYLLLALLVPA